MATPACEGTVQQEQQRAVAAERRTHNVNANTKFGMRRGRGAGERGGYRRRNGTAVTAAAAVASTRRQNKNKALHEEGAERGRGGVIMIMHGGGIACLCCRALESAHAVYACPRAAMFLPAGEGVRGGVRA